MSMRLVRDDEDPSPVSNEFRRRCEQAKTEFGGINNAAHRPGPQNEKPASLEKLEKELRVRGIEIDAQFLTED